MNISDSSHGVWDKLSMLSFVSPAVHNRVDKLQRTPCSFLTLGVVFWQSWCLDENSVSVNSHVSTVATLGPEKRTFELCTLHLTVDIIVPGEGMSWAPPPCGGGIWGSWSAGYRPGVTHCQGQQSKYQSGYKSAPKTRTWIRTEFS